jgi:hypothetical protein
LAETEVVEDLQAAAVEVEVEHAEDQEMEMDLQNHKLRPINPIFFGA